MLLHWLWLATRTGMGDRTKAALLEYFGSPEDIYFAPELELKRFENLSPAGVESMMDKDLGDCEKLVMQCRKKGIGILTMQDAAYPERLKNIPDPPPVLYYKGNLPDFDGNPVIGVVGTRKASVYGLNIAKRLGYQLGACGGLVVSGVASGIDGLAMKGALTAGGTVVGVLGCGADVVYPASNRGLYGDTERYGCLLTEFPPGTPPLGKNFPRRNRIISGLSCGVLVVEAPEQSGALITAKLALDQGRDVFVVPSNIDSDTGRGSNALLREGATPVMTGWDILSEYAPLFPGKLRKSSGGTSLEADPEEQTAEPVTASQRQKSPVKKPKKEPSLKKTIDKKEITAYSDTKKTPAALNPAEEEIISQLRDGPKLLDDVIAEIGKVPGLVLATVTVLEVRGIVRRLPGRLLEWTGK